ncbi:MAG: hypothetical protein ABSA02_25500 [Trebonia sp.]
MLLLQLVLVVWLGPSVVVAHPGGPSGFQAAYSIIDETIFEFNEYFILKSI